MAVTKGGNYRAKPVAWGTKLTNNGVPNIAIAFVICSDEFKDEKVFWQGGLNQEVKNTKSQLDITLDSLEACGFDLAKHKNLNVIAEGPAGGALDPEREVMLTIEMETYEGKPQARVKWVNDLAGAKFKGAIAKDEFAAKCQGLGIEAALMRRRNERGIKAPTSSPGGAADPRASVPDLSNIPF